MGNKAAKMWDRLENNRFTAKGHGQRQLTEDLSAVRILHVGLDTAKQLYTGGVTGRYQEIKELYDSDFGAIVQVAGHFFKLGPAGKSSGYRYRLQNNKLGLILLYGSIYIKDEDLHNVSGNNLKIECSPEFLYERTFKQAQECIDSIAKELLEHSDYISVSPHLCADVQGWVLPDDFEERFVSRARRQQRHQGISDFSFENSTSVVRYNQIETFMSGLPSSIQFSIYDKTKEALKRDKIHFWESVWKTSSDDLFTQNYSDDESVTRLELRFHHTVIKQFSDGLSIDTDENGREVQYLNRGIRCIADLDGHLNGLWFYGLMNFRLQYNTTTIDPFWQLLIEDVKFHDSQPDINYKRAYKKPAIGSEKNVPLAVGNTLALLHRRGFRPETAFKYFRKSAIWLDISAYYHSRGLTSEHFKQNIEKVFQQRDFLR